MTVYLVFSLPNIPYIHCIYTLLANPNREVTKNRAQEVTLEAPGLWIQLYLYTALERQTYVLGTKVAPDP
jgi:hypothetical protein